MGAELDLSVVILSFNVSGLLRNCLLSLGAGQNEIRFETIVVDNGSDDDSVALVRREFPHVRLIDSQTNGGYAYGNNLALREIMARSSASWPRYILLLNSDTVVPSGALARMVDFLDANPEAGAAGPKLVRPDGTLDLACRRSFPSPEVSFYRMLGLSKLFPRHRRFASYNLTYLSPDEIYELDSVVGAFMMVRTSALREVGFLDEQFFMYGEDLDWAYRIKSRGWKVLYNGHVQVVHHKGASSRKRSTRSVFEFYRAMLVFYRKHYYGSTARPISWLVIAGIYLRGALALAQNQVRLSVKRFP